MCFKCSLHPASLLEAVHLSSCPLAAVLPQTVTQGCAPCAEVNQNDPLENYTKLWTRAPEWLHRGVHFKFIFFVTVPTFLPRIKSSQINSARKEEWLLVLWLPNDLHMTSSLVSDICWGQRSFFYAFPVIDCWGYNIFLLEVSEKLASSDLVLLFL